jgi:hypothetical protein
MRGWLFLLLAAAAGSGPEWFSGGLFIGAGPGFTGRRSSVAL